MPYYSAGTSDSGVLPVTDKNQTTPTGVGAQSGDPVATPEFIIQLQSQLADIRNELSDLMAVRYGNIASPPMASKATAESVRRAAANDLRKHTLEDKESAIVMALNNYLYSGTLGDYDTATEASEEEEGD